MPPRSPDKTFHDLLPFSPPTPASASEKASQDQERPVPPGTLVRYFWTCHHCGCGTFRCNDVSVAVCVQCAHEICDGCTAFFGAHLLRCVEAEHLPSHAPNPGCACEQPSTSSRCRRSHPIRRCPVASGTRRRMRHEPYGRPSPVQHCVVTFRPGRDGRPALGTFFFTRPRFNRSRLRAWPPCDTGTSTGTSSGTGSTRSGTRPGGQETLNCIARSVAAARAAPAIIPPIYDMLRQPLRGEPATARRGTPVCTIALARFFAAGAASVARALGVARHPVVCVRVDPMLAFVAYYLCAHFYAVFGATWKETTTARQPSRAAPE